ncbi:magnesium transporter [Pseudohyphozyma bogoriensis]|nr:magnesium transporter [Pseudohyphozyma bogoriensis]
MKSPALSRLTDDDGDDTVEEQEDSDAEVEGLLTSTSPAIRRASEPKPSSTLPAGTKAGWSSWNGLTGSMSAADRKVFAREMVTQTMPIMVLSLLGAVLTGFLLEKQQNWKVFIRVEELFILVPILLNLKGNLEMNLAARFSTSANIGELDLRLTRRSLVFGNMALLQVQALLVSFVAGLLAFVLGSLARNGVHHSLQHPLHNPGSATNAAAGGTEATDALRGGYFEALLVLCVSMLAASFSSAILGSFMCSLVIICRRFKINPDNIATPLASALGDLVTLVILGGLSSLFVIFMGTLVSTGVFLLLLGAIALNTVITFRNAYVQELLSVGWTPLILAMIISSGSGVILEAYVNDFEGFALFAPVLTAVTGNAGSIFVSRISTALHASRKEHYIFVSIALFVITIPTLMVFLVFVWITNQAPVTFVFAIGFLVCVGLQTIISLVVGYFLCIVLWKKDYDPDVYALPLLSSLLDLTGQLMLVGVFSVARLFSGTPSDAAGDVASGVADAAGGVAALLL